MKPAEAPSSSQQRPQIEWPLVLKVTALIVLGVLDALQASSGGVELRELGMVGMLFGAIHPVTGSVPTVAAGYAMAPVLLTMPAYGGTLAAARCLGRHGVPVTMAGEEVFAPARWSRYVTRRVSCPSTLQVERFFDWLMDFGKSEPGHVLYPTCDDLAWLYADRAEALSQYYRLYSPKADAILALVDKKSLHELCVELGIPSLPTAFPKNAAEAVRKADSIGFPMLLKPRTQVLLASRGKGVYVDNPRDLPYEHAKFLDANEFHPALKALRPHLEQPMLQAFRHEAAENIYSLSGFIGAGDIGYSMRAAVKVLQRPRRLGVGLCFEEAAVEPEALDAILRLCKRVGYYGVFEAEFVRDGQRLDLIDFNPRFYGQMGFDVARELPSPYLAWLGASGNEAQLKQAIEASRNWKEGRGYVYCNGFFFKLMLSLQGVSGWMTEADRTRWEAWLAERSAQSLAFDAIDEPEDRLPAAVSIVRDLYFAARHPRSFYRQMIVGP
jgi:D-aspartate ligase